MTRMQCQELDSVSGIGNKSRENKKEKPFEVSK